VSPPAEASEIQVAAEHDQSAGELMLIVETSAGVMIRRVPAATPLQPGRGKGLAAEEATHGAAATWSVPDFVYRPKVHRAGSGSRELGDSFLIVGEMGSSSR
jgi:hypothetical protein